MIERGANQVCSRCTAVDVNPKRRCNGVKMSSSVEHNRYFPPRQHSKADVERVFGKNADGNLATRLYRENRAYYESLRQQAVADGLQQERGVASPVARMVLNHQAEVESEQNRVYGDEELRARAQFSPERCKELLNRTGNEGNADNLSNLKANDPTAYRAFKVAAYSYGLTATAPAPEVAPKQPELDTRVAISDSLADTFNLPRGTRVPGEHLSRLIELQSQINGAKEAA